jgi:hypothetical protein
MIKTIQNLQKILFLTLLGLFMASTVFAAEEQTEEDTTDQTEAQDEGTELSAAEEDPMSLPNAWLRLINIMQKGLEVCNLEGNDFKVFGEDINLVTQSPFKNRTSLEKIRFNQVLKSARQHKAFINQATQQIKIIKIQEMVKKLITLNDYIQATEYLLNNFDSIDDKRNKEILSYFSYMVTYNLLSNNDKDNIRALLSNAMNKMPGDQEQLQQFLDLLNRQPEVITKVIREGTQDIRLTGNSGASSRGLGNQTAHIATRQDKVEQEQIVRKERAQQIAGRAAEAAAKRAAMKQQ